MKQTQMPQATPIGFFYAFKMALQKVAAFDCLNDRWPAILMSGANVSRSQGTLHAVAFQLSIHGRQSLKKAIVGIAGLVVRGKGHADCREARSLHLACQVYIGSGHFSGGEWNVNVIMGIDPGGLGYKVRHSRVGNIRRPTLRPRAG